jgi:hypothetical protein
MGSFSKFEPTLSSPLTPFALGVTWELRVSSELPRLQHGAPDFLRGAELSIFHQELRGQNFRAHDDTIRDAMGGRQWGLHLWGAQWLRPGRWKTVDE